MVDESLNEARPGALRSRIVAKLAGVTLRQLGYWHRTDLIRARVLKGGPGHPRMYSWEDYMKVRAAKKLLLRGLPTRRIRLNIEFLDEEVPGWPFRGIDEFAGSAVYHAGSTSYYVIADPGRQAVFPMALEVLEEVEEEGVLGELRSFQPDVEMNPYKVSGNPVVRGTRIETEFLQRLTTRGLLPTDIGRIYELPPKRVTRAVEFQRLAA